MGSPLVGAWEAESDTSEGFLILTETHCSMTFNPKNRKRFQGSEPTEEEAAEAYRTLGASAGTYTVSGSTAILREIVCRVPNHVGGDLKIEFAIEGDRMTAVITQPDGTEGGEVTLRKVS